MFFGLLSILLVLSVFARSRRSKVNLNVATYNVYNFPNLASDEPRRLLKEKHFTEILESKEIDVICLEEVNAFMSDIQSYIFDDSNLTNAFPFIYSTVNEFTDEEKILPRIPCDEQQIEAINNECITNSCGNLYSESSIFEFAYCIALLCPEQTAILQRTECSGCLIGFASQPLNTTAKICSAPIDFNFKFTGGVVLLSKYELMNTQTHELPAFFDVPRFLLTGDIELPINAESNKRQVITIGCTHLVSPNNAPFVTFDEEVIDAGVDSFEGLVSLEIETINNIFNQNECCKNNPKILLGDFNSYVTGIPEEGALSDSFQLFLDSNWKPSTLVVKSLDFECSWCNRLVNDTTNDNICNSMESNVNPLIDSTDQLWQVLIDNVLLKDFKISKDRDFNAHSQTDVRIKVLNVERFMEDCYDYSIGNDSFSTPISDHYAVTAQLKIKF